MRLKLILPRVFPTDLQPPTLCPYEGCGGRHFQFHQAVEKPLRDTRYREVEAHRYECLRCRRTFRVYPQGVTRAQTSLRVKGLAVLLYLLGLSYGAVSLALEALGTYLCKSRVYDAVQSVAERVPGLKRKQVFEGLRTPALGSDLTSVKVNGQWLTLLRDRCYPTQPMKRGAMMLEVGADSGRSGQGDMLPRVEWDNLKVWDIADAARLVGKHP